MANITAIGIAAFIFSTFVNIYHMICQFVTINLSKIIAARFCAINFVFGINCSPINFRLIKKCCIFQSQAELLNQFEKVVWNFFLCSFFSLFLGFAIFLFTIRFRVITPFQLNNYIACFIYLILRLTLTSG